MISAPKAIRTLLSRLPISDDGSSAVEWGILASCIAAVVIATIGGLGQHVSALYQSVVTLIEAFL